MGSLFIRVIRGKTHFNGLRRTAGVTVRATRAARRRRRAAPTAFQRTSLLMKCNTEDGDCKNFLPAEHAEINARIGLSKKDAGLVFHEFSGRAS
jgi:hypothetical protein